MDWSVVVTAVAGLGGVIAGGALTHVVEPVLTERQVRRARVDAAREAAYLEALMYADGCRRLHDAARDLDDGGPDTTAEVDSPPPGSVGAGLLLYGGREIYEAWLLMLAERAELLRHLSVMTRGSSVVRTRPGRPPTHPAAELLHAIESFADLCHAGSVGARLVRRRGREVPGAAERGAASSG